MENGIYFKRKNCENWDIDRDALADIHGYGEKWTELHDSDKLSIIEKLIDRSTHDFIAYNTPATVEILFALYELIEMIRKK